MSYECIVWDFNGTILDDVGIGIKSVNRLLEKRGLKTLKSIEEYHNVFGFPIIEYYRRLGFDFEKEPFSVLADEWAEYYDEYCPSAALFEGVTDALSCFHSQGKKQVVVSMAEKTRLIKWLSDLGIINYFEEVVGLDNIYASSKVEVAQQWLKKAKPQNALMIGDTVHDYDVACALGIDCVLVSCGHQSCNELKKCGVPVYSSIKELPFPQQL